MFFVFINSLCIKRELSLKLAIDMLVKEIFFRGLELHYLTKTHSKMTDFSNCFCKCFLKKYLPFYIKKSFNFPFYPPTPYRGALHMLTAGVLEALGYFDIF